MLKKILNEVKLGSGEKMFTYLELIKKSVNSKIMNMRNEENALIVDFDKFSLIFKNKYLVGLIVNDRIYRINPKLKSVKDIKKLWDDGELWDKEIESIKDLGDGIQPKYKVDNKFELRKIIKNSKPNEDLNYLDVSSITDMSGLFAKLKFNGDISEWDVSNVENMSVMFFKSSFNGDISKWNVSNVKDMSSMFENSQFSRCEDLEKWNVSKNCDTEDMFSNCKCKKLPSWYKE